MRSGGVSPLATPWSRNRVSCWITAVARRPAACRLPLAAPRDRVAHQGFAEHVDERRIAGQERPSRPRFDPAEGRVQTAERLPGARNAGDEDDDLSGVALGRFEMAIDPVGGRGEIAGVGARGRDVGDVVPREQETGRVDDARDRLVARPFPAFDIDPARTGRRGIVQRTEERPETGRDRILHGADAADQQRKEAGRRLCRIGRDQHGHDRREPAPGMEILQVERVTFNLLPPSAVETVGADLELDDEDGSRRDQHRVGPAAEPRDRPFEAEQARLGTRPVTERLGEDRARRDPGPPLRRLVRAELAGGRVRERRRDRDGSGGEERRDRSRPPGAHPCR